MRIRLLVTIFLVCLVAACGGGAGATNTATSKPVAGKTATPPPRGPVDCEAIAAAAGKLVGIQLLAQLSSPATVEAIRSQQTGGLDLDVMLDALDDLHALDAYASPLGEPKAAIEVYEKAATAAKDLFEMEPVTQAAIDAFNTENVGTVGAFLGHQVAISGAIDEAGC
jgi:hypothetical protein